MKYSTFLLDLDHTLLDSDTSETLAFERTLRAAGIDDAGQYRDSYRRINLELWAEVERHVLTPQEVRDLRFKRLVDEQGLAVDAEQMSADFVHGLGANGELYDGALDVLQQLSTKAALALVTNGLSEVQRARIERLDIGRYFDAIVISAEVGTAKPGTDIFDIVFSELGSPAHETAIMVGDNLASDIKGGSNYGIATCWYNPRAATAEVDDAVTHEIATLGELLNFVAD